MIYQINYELNQSYDKFFKLLESVGDFIFINKTIYINTIEHKSDVIKKIKEVITDEEQYMVKSVDMDSTSLPYQVQQWIDKINFEQYMIEVKKEQQEIKNNMMKFLEDFENNLKQQIKDGGGVNAIKQSEESG